MGAAAYKCLTLNFPISASVVNRFKSELVSMGVLYAINAKTEPGLTIKKNQPGAYPQGSQPNGYFLSGSEISVSELLEYVNEYFPDILPEDVLKHFGHDSRPDGELGRDTLYQQRTDTLTDRELLSVAAEQISILTNLTDGERDALRSLRTARTFFVRAVLSMFG